MTPLQIPPIPFAPELTVRVVSTAAPEPAPVDEGARDYRIAMCTFAVMALLGAALIFVGVAGAYGWWTQ